jgi:septum formation protein
MTESNRRGLILASRSTARRRLLGNAGLSFSAVDPMIDELSLRQAMQAEQAAAPEIARTLAELKALKVSRQHGNTMVIGADQVLSCGAILFDKPADLDQARASLRALRGQTHTLVSAVCVAAEGAVVWHHSDQASLLMRRFSDDCLEAYMAAEGAAVLESVGAYRLEGPGAQLFERVHGDYFTVLGLPLLPLLAFLRGHGFGLPA